MTDMSEQGNKAYQYKPEGVPWVRGLITVMYLVIFALTLRTLLQQHADMSTVEVSIVSMLVGALGTELKTIIAWWFRQENGNHA